LGLTTTIYQPKSIPKVSLGFFEVASGINTHTSSFSVGVF